MSGPKSSRYTVTAARQRALAEQRKRKLLEQQLRILEEQRRIEQERKENCIWVKNTLGQIQKENSTFGREQAVAKELTAKTGNDHGLQRLIQEMQTSVYKGYKQDKIEMRGDRAEMSDFPLYLNTVAGGLDRRDQTIGGFSFVVKIYAVPVVEIIG